MRRGGADARGTSGRLGTADTRRLAARCGISAVVAGLGNPGARYERTRHNAGFLVVDELARRHGAVWRAEERAETASLRFGSGKVTLLKPRTYMNGSGAALVGYEAKDVIVVHGDMDLPAGDVRVKVGGGSGGHKGLGSVIGILGRSFLRVRVGVGRPPDGTEAAEHVLSRMGREVEGAVPVAADAVEVVLREGAATAMNLFNARRR